MTLPVAALLALAPGESPTPRTAAVVEVRGVPLLGTDGSRKAVARIVEPAGWQVAAFDATASAGDEGLKRAARGAGVSRVFLVDVAPVSGAKFRYEIGLRVLDVTAGVEGGESRTCEPCLMRRDFERTIGTLAATLSAQLDVEAERARAAAALAARAPSPPPPPVAVVAEAAPARSGRRPLLGGSLVAAGLVGIGMGATLLYLDGRTTECSPECWARYRTHGGVPLVIAGGALVGVGLWAWAPWAKSGKDIALLVAPNGVAVAGRF